MRLHQYSEGDEVEVSAHVDKETTCIQGYIQKVLPAGDDLQVLTIYGKTLSGRSINTRKYNDDKSLKLLSTLQNQAL